MKRFFYFPATKLIIPTVLAVGALLGFSRSVESAPIYSQILPTEPGAAFSSNDTLTGQKSADNFALAGQNPVTIRSIRFIGGYGVRNPPPNTPPLDTLPLDNFRILFLEDDGGSPGLPIPGGDLAIELVYSRVPTGGQLLNGVRNPIEFIVNLDRGITLSPNTEYWLAITNNLETERFWSWARASGLLDSNTAATFGDITNSSWNVFATGGMWFELNNEVIPEPASSFLLSIAIATATLNRRRWQVGQYHVP